MVELESINFLFSPAKLMYQNTVNVVIGTERSYQKKFFSKCQNIKMSKFQNKKCQNLKMSKCRKF